jgi:hypothetical protein
MISPRGNTRWMSGASLPRWRRDRFTCSFTPEAGISLSGRRRITLISSARSSSLSREACWRRISRQVSLSAKAAEQIRRGELDESPQPTIDMMAGPGGWERTPEYGRQMLRGNAATVLGQIKE